MSKDNVSSHFYYHFISMVKEVENINLFSDKESTREEIQIAIGIQTILENIRYKNKSYTDILRECNLLKDENEKRTEYYRNWERSNRERRNEYHRMLYRLKRDQIKMEEI